MSQSSIGLSVWAASVGQTQGGGEVLVPAGGGTPGTTSGSGTVGGTGVVGSNGTPATGTGGQPAAGSLGMWVYLPLVALVIFMFWTSHRQQKKEQTKRQDMLKTMHRGDKVQTLGGIIGTVADIGEDEIVLTVEQGRIRFSKSAVQQIIKSSVSKSEAVVETKPEGAAAKA
ncbi:MAG: preprotein translocase subunit YajC [Phycisphaerales bacterium]